MEQGGERGSGRERELCPKQAAIKRALKKGQKKKREGSAYTTDKANKAAEGVGCMNCRYPVERGVESRKGAVQKCCTYPVNDGEELRDIQTTQVVLGTL